MNKENEMRDNQPIGGDLDKNNIKNDKVEYDFDEELYEFKTTLEELNNELKDELLEE